MLDRDNTLFIPENVTAQNLYIEPYVDIDIELSKDINNNGILSEDKFKNDLQSKINIGSSYITFCSGVTEDYLLLYYDTKYALINDRSRNIQFPIEWDKPIEYKLGAKKIDNVALDLKNNTITIPDEYLNYEVFKLYINNIEIKNQWYKVNSNKITLYLDAMKELELFDNNIVLIIYPKSQNLNGKKITLTYKGVKKIFDKETFIDESYFQTGNIDHIINYEELQYQEDSQSDTYGHDKIKKSIFYDKSCKITLTTFVGKNLLNIREKYQGVKFRIIINHPITESIEIFTNCEIVNTFTKTFTKEKNTEAIEIQTEGQYLLSYDTIDDILSVNRPYGKGLYGTGLYGK